MKHLAPNQKLPLIEIKPGLWIVDTSNAVYLGFWDKNEPGDKKYLNESRKL